MAFQKLESAFIIAHILCHPDPDLPFVIEGYESETGLGAMLSKLYPVAFFLRKLSSNRAKL